MRLNVASSLCAGELQYYIFYLREIRNAIVLYR